jgi:CHAT domain-containing protein
LTDDHPGLASAFLVAGVHTVIASLWMVEDFSTALLISRFHENIYLRGMGKAAGLRAAQRCFET